MSSNEQVGYSIEWMIERWDEDQTRWTAGRFGLVRPQAADFYNARVQPYSISNVQGNLLTTAGLTRLASLVNGAGGQALTNTATRLGVGNGAGTAAVGDTDLSAAAGSANRWFNVMDATFPSVSGAVLTAKATFASADGNFAWNEFGLDVGTPTVTSSAVVAATLFNHKTSIAQGTKASGQSWAATATITFS